MKFYKVHAAKYKDSKVLFIPEQFDEIGPDVFRQTNFEYIILSRKVKTIKNHAFSDLKQCKVYLPKTIEEIEPLAFADIDDGNEFYCVKDTVAYNACLVNQLKINDNIEECISHAEGIRDTEKTKNKTAKRQEQDIKPKENTNNSKNIKIEQSQLVIEENKTIEQKEVNIEYVEPIQASNQEVRKEGKQLPQDEQKNQIHDVSKKAEVKKVPDEAFFFEKFGLPPIVDVSPMGMEWKKQISQMETSEIIERYDSDEYCDEYRYYCYEELKFRYNNNTLEIKPNPKEIISGDVPLQDTQMSDDTYGEEIIDESDISYLLGMPPKCDKISGFNAMWKKDIHELSTKEILDRYDSDEWTDEYRYLCYKELSIREDLETIICN